MISKGWVRLGQTIGALLSSEGVNLGLGMTVGEKRNILTPGVVPTARTPHYGGY